MSSIKIGDTVRVISTGHVGRVSSTTAFGKYCKVGYEDGIRLHNYPMHFHRDELEVVAANPFQVGDLVVKKGDGRMLVVQVHEVIYTIGELVYLTPNFCIEAKSLLLYYRPQPVPAPSPTDTIISAFNDMEKEIAALKAELADLNKQLLRSRAETQHAIAIHEHYKIFHPVH